MSFIYDINFCIIILIIFLLLDWNAIHCMDEEVTRVHNPATCAATMQQKKMLHN